MVLCSCSSHGRLYISCLSNEHELLFTHGQHESHANASSFSVPGPLDPNCRTTTWSFGLSAFPRFPSFWLAP